MKSSGLAVGRDGRGRLGDRNVISPTMGKVLVTLAACDTSET